MGGWEVVIFVITIAVTIFLYLKLNKFEGESMFYNIQLITETFKNDKPLYEMKINYLIEANSKKEAIEKARKNTEKLHLFENEKNKENGCNHVHTIKDTVCISELGKELKDGIVLDINTEVSTELEEPVSEPKVEFETTLKPSMFKQ